jgi:hypothetical protein
MLSRIIRSNPTIPPVPFPTRHEKPSRKKFPLHVFISGSYEKAMVQRQSITSMEVHPQTLILRLPQPTDVVGQITHHAGASLYSTHRFTHILSLLLLFAFQSVFLGGQTLIDGRFALATVSIRFPAMKY